ncbi:hypothetical protein TNCV_1439431 [Trichonephila clavipes]|nr:hypothetical protein TNCV_1439431 [Trichonephila clavipes]
MSAPGSVFAETRKNGSLNLSYFGWQGMLSAMLLSAVRSPWWYFTLTSIRILGSNPGLYPGDDRLNKYTISHWVFQLKERMLFRRPSKYPNMLKSCSAQESSELTHRHPIIPLLGEYSSQIRCFPEPVLLSFRDDVSLIDNRAEIDIEGGRLKCVD